MTSWYTAPTLTHLIHDINARWIHRDKTSDGIIGDARHQAQHSDHNPDPTSHPPGVVRAVDIDVDLDGVAHDSHPDASYLVGTLLRHPATHYVIYSNTIWDRSYNFRARDYQRVNPGGDPHTNHIHLSILHGHENDPTPWFTDTPEMDDMPFTPEQLTSIIHDAVRSTPITNKFGQTFEFKDLIAAIDANILSIPDNILHHTVETVNPHDGKPQTVTVDDALGRAAEATIIRQADGITTGETPGTVTEQMAAVLERIRSGQDDQSAEFQEQLNALGKGLGAKRPATRANPAVESK